MHVQSNGGWLGGWLGGRLGGRVAGWPAGRNPPPPLLAGAAPLQVPFPRKCTRAQRDRFQYEGWNEGLQDNRASRGPSVRPSGPHRAHCGVLGVRLGWDSFEKEISLGREACFKPGNSGAIRLPLHGDVIHRGVE